MGFAISCILSVYLLVLAVSSFVVGMDARIYINHKKETKCVCCTKALRLNYVFPSEYIGCFLFTSEGELEDVKKERGMK
jgi:hypothetical protein